MSPGHGCEPPGGGSHLDNGSTFSAEEDQGGCRIKSGMTAPAFDSVRRARLVAVLAADPSDGAGRGAHDDAFGRDAVRPALDALEQRAVGDARRGEDAVALGEILEMIDPV